MPHLETCARLLMGWGEAVLRRPAQWIVRDGLPHLLWPSRDQAVLLLGHFDTVWPAGTIKRWPFATAAARATGPGMCDMKAGIVQMFAALGMLADNSRVGVLLTCHGESGLRNLAGPDRRAGPAFWRGPGLRAWRASRVAQGHS